MIGFLSDTVHGDLTDLSLIAGTIIAIATALRVVHVRMVRPLMRFANQVASDIHRIPELLDVVTDHEERIARLEHPSGGTTR